MIENIFTYGYINIWLYFSFLSSGKPSPDPQHPDYVPSIFSFKHKSIKEGQKKLIRYERSVKRKRYESVTEASDDGN